MVEGLAGYSSVVAASRNFSNAVSSKRLDEMRRALIQGMTLPTVGMFGTEQGRTEGLGVVQPDGGVSGTERAGQYVP